jgi:hypothetical protein
MQEVKRTAECGDNNEEPYSSFNSFWVTQSIDYLLMYKFGVHSVLANILDQLVMLLLGGFTRLCCGIVVGSLLGHANPYCIGSLARQAMDTTLELDRPIVHPVDCSN